ncbi:MAG TPA: hypothetical protein VNL38_02085 [Candidatus Nitrosotenuis sp.]|nr:hypothetical protein [Candidatus Nitrosotenuis sp.]
MFTDNASGLLISSSLKLVLRLIRLSLLIAFFLTSTYGQTGNSSQKSDEPKVNPKLSVVRRVCVQGFGTDTLSLQAQETIIARLFETTRFSITENCEKAEFVLKGSVVERVEVTQRSESEGIGFGQAGSASSSSSSKVGSVGSSSSASAAGRISANTHESLSSSEVKQQAALTLRIVDRDGEVIWATSQETGGGKSKSAVGLAAEMAVRRLLRDIERAEKQKLVRKD